jgi:hypothetical protein
MDSMSSASKGLTSGERIAVPTVVLPLGEGLQESRVTAMAFSVHFAMAIFVLLVE